MTTLISVVVSVYNGQKYLQECIESIINQDYKNIEIILLDDGSNDESPKLCDDFAKEDDRIRVIHKKNSGVSSTRNVGIESAKGDYICIIDQDDIISRDYINYFFHLLKVNQADIALTPDADKFFRRPNDDKADDYIQIWNGEQATIEMLYHKIIIAPWNKLISRKLIEDNHIRFNPDLFGGEGFAFSIECYQHAKKIAIGHRKVYHYRVGNPESGASKFRVNTIHSYINSQAYIRSKLIRPSKELLKAWQFSNWHSYCDALNIMVGCGVTKEYEDLYDSLKIICRREAFCALQAPVSVQQKIRGILFRINPYIASRVINHFRLRKFSRA